MDENRIRRVSGLIAEHLVILIVFSIAAVESVSASDETITPNAHSERVGPEQIEADTIECIHVALAEKRRLLDELLQGEPQAAAKKLLGDVSKHDEQKLAYYLGVLQIPGAGYSAMKRLQFICLRARGYEVENHAEDGAGTAVLVWGTATRNTRIVLREEDGSERVFYEHAKQDSE